MNVEKELLIKKAHEGYTVCYAEQCPLRQQCLRRQIVRCIATIGKYASPRV